MPLPRQCLAGPQPLLLPVDPARAADSAPCGDDDGGSPDTALITDDGDARGFTKSEGDLLLNGARLDVHQPERVTFNPGYAFTVEPATEALRDRVRINAGPRTTTCR